MLKIANLLFFQSSYSWEVTFGLAITGFIIGFIFKKAIIYKQRKRILYLEDEMLSNHARILELEKKLAEFKEKPAERKEFEVIKGKDRNTKIS